MSANEIIGEPAAIGQSGVRICATCGEVSLITVTSTGDGWLTYRCEKNGCVRLQRIMGTPN